MRLEKFPRSAVQDEWHDRVDQLGFGGGENQYLTRGTGNEGIALKWMTSTAVLLSFSLRPVKLACLFFLLWGRGAESWGVLLVVGRGSTDYR